MAPGAAHLRFDIEAFEVENRRNAMLSHSSGDAMQVAFGPGGIDDDMAVFIGKGDEIPFRIDDALLHPCGALFE